LITALAARPIACGVYCYFATVPASRRIRRPHHPVQAPSKYETALNMRTAKALGLTIPETLLATADE